ncbi:hypothetical protein B0H13DRAFT_1893952 [Mycena leptocephala]|nr:hypothetical protein B0H13DRAFT_1893952 [Mycena leptocephala]
MNYCPPTHAAAYAKLLAPEVEAEKAGGTNHTGVCAIIATALQIEKDQCNCAAPTEADDEVVQMARGRLMQDLSELRTQQGQRVPELAWPMKNIDVEQPEKEALFLPSDYSATVRDELKLGHHDQALQLLLREHLWGKLKDGKVQVAGQVKESDPWFWRVGRPSTLSQADEKNWNRELDRDGSGFVRSCLEVNGRGNGNGEAWTEGVW